MVIGSERDDLIDVAVRLPRKVVEEAMLSTVSFDGEAASRRYHEAKAILSGLRRRTACFSGIRFCDPSWEMILELYVATLEGRNLAVSQLCSLSGGSTTTALRHVEHLEALGYVSREIDEEDKRRTNVSMLASLRDAAERWLDLQFAASRIGS